MYGGPSNSISSVMDDPLTLPSPDTPLVDENNNANTDAYSPISNDGHDVEPRSRPGSGFVNSFVPMPMPHASANTYSTPPLNQPRGTSSQAQDIREIMDALRVMERRFISEVAAVREEVADVGRRLDHLASSVATLDAHGRQYAENLQGNLTGGVNHLIAIVTGRRNQLHQVSALINDLVGQDSSTS